MVQTNGVKHLWVGSSGQTYLGSGHGVVSDEDVARVWMLLELLFIRSGVYQLDNFSVSDVKALIDSLCTC